MPAIQDPASLDEWRRQLLSFKQARHLLSIGLIVLAVLVIVVYWFICWGSPTTVLLIRHADRQGGQDVLSPVGVTRAQELVHVMGKASLNAIYHSEALRTQQTAALLAAATGLTPTQIAAANTSELVNDIRTNHRGHTVLVVGHSNTIPAIITALGGPSIPNIVEDEFDNLFMLTLCRCSWPGAKLINLQYGAVSP